MYKRQLLDRPISEPDAAGDSIRWPVVEPDRDVRPFQTVLLDLGARLGLAPMVNADGSPKFKDYADYIANHIRRPGAVSYTHLDVYKRQRWRRAAAFRPPAAGGWRPNGRMWRSTRRSRSRSPGRISAVTAMRRCRGAR